MRKTIGKDVLTVRIEPELKESLKRIGNNSITAGLRIAIASYQDVKTASQEVPSWYFNADAVSNVDLYNWLKNLEDTDKNVKYIKQFWVIASGRMPEYKGNARLARFMETMIIDHESPFYVPLAEKSVKPLIDGWASMLDVSEEVADLLEDKGQLEASIKELVDVMLDIETTLTEIKMKGHFPVDSKEELMIAESLKMISENITDCGHLGTSVPKDAE
jgi:hypothetical protein